MFSLALLAPLFAVVKFASVTATPVELTPRYEVLTDKTDSASVMDGYYLLENNLWGMDSATSGWQNSQEISVHGGSVAWQTSYSWTGGQYSVKSYANLDLKSGLPKQLSAISSAPTAWYWQYPSASSNLVADVSYDLWLSADRGTQGATASTTYEIMIWLSSRGNATPAGKIIGTPNVNGIDWKLYKGTIKTWTIFSFVAPTETKNFNSNLKPFLVYLTSQQGVPSSQYLVQAQAGTEPFVGNATFLTNAYSFAVLQQ